MTPTDALAAAMCDARFRYPMWETMNEAQRAPWRREAERILGKLAQLGFGVVEAGGDRPA